MQEGTTEEKEEGRRLEILRKKVARKDGRKLARKVDRSHGSK